jgi:hypothetical protein
MLTATDRDAKSEEGEAVVGRAQQLFTSGVSALTHTESHSSPVCSAAARLSEIAYDFAARRAPTRASFNGI